VTLSSRIPGATPPSLSLARVWYAIGALMLFVVGLLSLLPAAGTGVNDKLAHLVTYFLLAGWFAVIARDCGVLAWSLLGLICYGVLIELLQAQTGYRYAEWGDVIANTGGCAIGILSYFTPLKRAAHVLDGWLAARLRG
jgi:VanZ family protein